MSDYIREEAKALYNIANSTLEYESAIDLIEDKLRKLRPTAEEYEKCLNRIFNKNK